jgi:hypothetical protein
MTNLYSNYTQYTKKFEDLPARGLIFLLKKLHLYELFKRHAKDGRLKRGLYSIASLLMVAFEILLFRCPSKNDFYQSKKRGRGFFYKNLGLLAQIPGQRFPHCKTIDDAFLSLDPSSLEPILFDIFKSLISAKLFSNHRLLKKHESYRLSIDAECSHHYTSASQHPCESCLFCLKREHKTKEGKVKVWYLHIEVLASLIFENGFQLPLYVHRIRKKKEFEDLSEEELKQECEQTALPLVLEKIRKYLPRLNITVLLDGLHSNRTSMDTLERFGFNWDIVLKRLKSVQEEIDTIDQTVRLVATKRFNLTQTASFTNNIPYCDHYLNAIEFNEHAQKKPSKRFAKIKNKQVHYQWIVKKLVSEANLFELIEEARSRWQGEDLINTLKNRGFNFKHDYSRHPSSQTIWKILSLIAFSLTSLYLISDIGIKARRKSTIYSLMREMLGDLFYLPYEIIFLCPYPKQLRFSLWSGAG